ncbi:NAD-dependent protein deacetylase [bioreactor metagenome]|uniref:NAD-dependent protein deacetylase n=1 Tax=bioreactor metagenome TaxID=1076179 RepID=A0A645F6F1_9ZZZZ
MKRIVAFTGAGVSKASGIPTFQDMDGIREKLSLDYFMSNTKDFYDVLQGMKRNVDKALPNAAHIAIAHHDIPVVTMNIDGLHKRAGSKKVIEVHGNLDYVLCMKCGKEYDFSCIDNSIYCRQCNGLLKPEVVLYGEMIAKYHEAIELISSADELLVVGTSFYTSTSSIMVEAAQMSGAKVTTINMDAETEVPRYLRRCIEGE